MTIKINFSETFKDVFADAGRILKRFEAHRPKQFTKEMEVSDSLTIEGGIYILCKRVMEYSSIKTLEWEYLGHTVRNMWEDMVRLERLINHWIGGYHGKLPRAFMGAVERLDDYCGLIDPDDNYYHMSAEDLNEILKEIKPLMEDAD